MVLVPEPVGEEGEVVVELPEEGAVVVAEPSPGAEAAGAEAAGAEVAGAEVVPIGEAGPPAPGVLGALTAAGFAEEDGAAFEDGTGALAAAVGGAPAGAAAPARGSTMPDTNG